MKRRLSYENIYFYIVFEAFKEEKVKYNRLLILTILSIWSGSLFQFTMVLTASKAQKVRVGFAGDQVSKYTDTHIQHVCMADNLEMLSLLNKTYSREFIVIIW